MESDNDVLTIKMVHESRQYRKLLPLLREMCEAREKATKGKFAAVKQRIVPSGVIMSFLQIPTDDRGGISIGSANPADAPCLAVLANAVTAIADIIFEERGENAG